jgi:iron complex outermembrane receptor protein
MHLCIGPNQGQNNSQPTYLASSFSRLLISTVLLASFLSGAVVTTAIAQEGVLEEVTVTAQRREQNIQDIGISISVFTSDQLEKLRVNQPADLATYTPGMYVSKGIAGNPIFSLRGIGMNNNESNQNPAVTPYIDQVPLPSIAMMGFQMFDLERVEILKGPQGTLYGRNVTGGAINFVTRKPSQEFDSSFSATYGRYELIDIEAAVGGGISENLAGRVAVKSITRNGWQTLITGIQPGDVDSNNGEVERQSARGSLLWTPSDTFDLHFVADYGSGGSETLGYKHAGTSLKTDAGVPCSYVTTGIRNEDECASFAIIRTGNGGDPVTGDLLSFSDPDEPPRTVFGNFTLGNIDDVESWGISNTMNWTLGRTVLTSVTGYRNMDRSFGFSNGVPFLLDDTFRELEIDVFTQEFRLASDESWGKFQWVLGLYYGKDEIDDRIVFDFRDHRSFSGFFDSAFYQETEDLAIFGHLEYQLNDDFRLIGGLRYTDEERFFHYEGSIIGPGPVPIPLFEDTVDASEPTGKIGIDWTPGVNRLYYFSISRGFKGPGFPATISFSEQQSAPFETETLMAYELGMKSTLAEGKVQFNAAAYYYDWQDFQATTAVDREGIRLIVLANAGDAEVYGVEAEVSWYATDEFILRAGVNIMEAEIKTGEFEGDTPVQSPAFSGTLLASWTPNTTFGSFKPFIDFDYTYRSKIELALPNNIADAQSGYGLLGLRAGLLSEDGKWEVSIWGRNLTDKLYLSQSFGGDSTFLSGRLVYADPRMYGATLRFRY